MQKSHNNRLEFIDALRGLAALYVVCFHMTLVPDFKMQVPDLIRPLVMNGWNGVTLFFVISAFTLCYTLHGKTNEPHSTLFFYIRRIFRIVPLYYVWLFSMFAIDWGTGVFSFLWSNKADVAIFPLFLYNFVPGKQEGIVWASWTLGVEMVFYAVFPLIFVWCNNLKRTIIGLCLSIVLAIIHFRLTHGFEGYSTFMGILHQLPIFMLGMVCFFLFEKIRIQPVAKGWGLAMLVFAGFSFVVLPYTKIDLYVPMLYLMALVFALLLIGLYIYPVKILIWKPTLFLGLISYSFYLNHPKLIYHMGSYYRQVYSLGLNNYLSFLVCLLSTIVALGTVSYITYSLIEKPGINFGRLLIKFIKTKTASPRLRSDVQ